MYCATPVGKDHHTQLLHNTTVCSLIVAMGHIPLCEDSISAWDSFSSCCSCSTCACSCPTWLWSRDSVDWRALLSCSNAPRSSRRAWTTKSGLVYSLVLYSAPWAPALTCFSLSQSCISSLLLRSSSSSALCVSLPCSLTTSCLLSSLTCRVYSTMRSCYGDLEDRKLYTSLLACSGALVYFTWCTNAMMQYN